MKGQHNVLPTRNKLWDSSRLFCWPASFQQTNKGRAELTVVQPSIKSVGLTPNENIILSSTDATSVLIPDILGNAKVTINEIMIAIQIKSDNRRSNSVNSKKIINRAYEKPRHMRFPTGKNFGTIAITNEDF